MVLLPQIGVVTVTFNSGAVLDPFLQCVFTQTQRSFLLFAVDNASNDDTLEILRRCGDDRLKTIANPDNRGVAEGNNQGIRAALEAGCKFVLLLNNDTEFDATLFSRLEEGLEQHGTDMICPKMMYFDDPKRIWAAGGEFRPWLAYHITHSGGDEIDVGQYDRARLVTYVPTCCVLIKREVFEKVGLMDERYFVYGDDMDFMFRANKAGIKLLYLPDAKLLHKVGRLTGGKASTFSLRWCTRNRIYFLLRHFGLMASTPMIVCYQFYFLARLLCGKLSFKAFRIKQKAVWEGFTVWRRSSQARINQCLL